LTIRQIIFNTLAPGWSKPLGETELYFLFRFCKMLS